MPVEMSAERTDADLATVLWVGAFVIAIYFAQEIAGKNFVRVLRSNWFYGQRQAIEVLQIFVAVVWSGWLPAVMFLTGVSRARPDTMARP